MSLSETWFMEGYIDFELQKYRLLSYIQDVRKSFMETKLYPQLSDIVAHYNNLIQFRKNKQLMDEGFPKTIEKIDTDKLEIVYERMLSDNDLMQELEAITEFAMAKMKDTINEGAELYDFVEKQMQVVPIGIMPLYKNEGYIFLQYGGHKDVRIYNYSVTIFEHRNARYRGIKMDYVDTRTKTLANTYEQMKLEIIREIRTLPNPAVYKVECEAELPFIETLLPVAKRVLVRMIA